SHIPIGWTQGSFIDRDLMIFRGQPYYSNTRRPGATSPLREWFTPQSSGPVRGRQYPPGIRWLFRSNALVENPGTRYDGNDYQCLHNGREIFHETCDAGCRRVGNVLIQQGLCMNNACFCKWKFPNTLYESIFLSLAVSINVDTSLTNGNIDLVGLLRMSSRDDSSPSDSATQLPVQLPDEGECEVLNEVSEPQPSCSGAGCEATDDMCRDTDGLMISKEKCNSKCWMLQTVYGLQITKGKCINGDCYCIYPPMQSGCSRKVELAELEKNLVSLPSSSRPDLESMGLSCRLGSSFFSE
ncbi:hypothetical protein QAD02_006001, partial [Eretmocerus hayati]